MSEGFLYLDGFKGQRAVFQGDLDRCAFADFAGDDLAAEARLDLALQQALERASDRGRAGVEWSVEAELFFDEGNLAIEIK